MWNIKFLCELTIVIRRLPCLFNMPNAVSSTIELVNLVTSECVNYIILEMCAVAWNCFPVELVTYSNEW